MYRYVPLPPREALGQTEYTRILHLKPGGEGMSIRGELEIVKLSAAPSYEALSYTWGRGPPSNYIWIGDKGLALSPNLEGALYSLRLTSSVRRLWIDALCIDQSNLEERSRQVLSMRSVYQACSSVIVWLGPRDNGVAEAFEAARIISDMAGYFEQGVPFDRGTFDEGVLADLVQSSEEGNPSMGMNELYKLFQRDYFSRCWVVQEVLVGTRPVAKCGDLEIPFFCLLSSIFFISLFRQTADMTTSLAMWYNIYTKRNASASPAWPQMVTTTKFDGSLGPLLDVLQNMRNFKATDPRDKVYSLLGICDEALRPTIAQRLTAPILATSLTSTSTSSRPLSITVRALSHVQGYVNNRLSNMAYLPLPTLKPDYTKDVVAVYTDVARYFISKKPMFLDILSYVQHHRDPSDTPGDAFPSWVPKWHELRWCSLICSGNFSAGICALSPSDFRTRVQRDIASHHSRLRPLVLDGIQVGIVSQVSDVVRIEGRDLSVRPAQIRALWSQLFPFPMGSGECDVPEGSERIDMAFCRAISISPVGPVSATMGGDIVKGLTLQYERYTKQDLERISRESIDAFLQDQEDKTVFLNAFGTFSWNRRAFVTTDGHIGCGPAFVRPGDEVVVLWRGRVPYILRRQPDKHILIGEAYVRDDDIMYGHVAESVWGGKGGRPSIQYRLG